MEIPAAVQAELAKVPELLGEVPAKELERDAIEDREAKEMSDVLGGVALPQVVTASFTSKLLTMSFDHIAAERRKVPFLGYEFGGRPHWRMTDERLGMVAEPTTAMLNQLWAVLKAYLPTFMTGAMESNPEVMAFIVGWSMVIGEMVAEDAKINAKEQQHAQGWEKRNAAERETVQ